MTREQEHTTYNNVRDMTRTYSQLECGLQIKIVNHQIQKTIIYKIYVQGYEFLSFAKNMSKNLSKKYSQKLFDKAKKSGSYAVKTTSKREIQKTAETITDLSGNKITDKITNSTSELHSKKSFKELHSGKEEASTDQYDNIIMEYYKIITLLDNTSKQLSEFRTKNWVEIMMNQEEHAILIVKLNLNAKVQFMWLQ